MSISHRNFNKSELFCCTVRQKTEQKWTWTFTGISFFLHTNQRGARNRTHLWILWDKSFGKCEKCAKVFHYESVSVNNLSIEDYTFAWTIQNHKLYRVLQQTFITITHRKTEQKWTRTFHFYMQIKGTRETARNRAHLWL